MRRTTRGARCPRVRTRTFPATDPAPRCPSNGRRRQLPRRLRRCRTPRRIRTAVSRAVPGSCRSPVEHQDVAVGLVRRTPAQRLMRMGDVDDRQSVEAEHHRCRRRRPTGLGDIRPGTGFVGSAVPHEVRRASHRVDGRFGDPPAACPTRASSPTPARVCRTAGGVGRNSMEANRQVCPQAVDRWSTLRSIRVATRVPAARKRSHESRLPSL